jgi:hypothetical protein
VRHARDQGRQKKVPRTQKKKTQKKITKIADDQVRDARDQGSSPFDCLWPQLLHPAGFLKKKKYQNHKQKIEYKNQSKLMGDAGEETY